MYCICCKKNNVIPDKFSYTKESMRGMEEKVDEEDILWKDSKRPDGSLVNVNNEMIDNGIIHIIDAGYGSTHDGDQFVIAICDDCIKENKQDATLLYYGNYMYAREGFVEEEKEKSKQKYRRRKNLDKLV
jgi:hypothetical protein